MKGSRWYLRSILFLLVSCTVPAHAASLVVNTTADGNDGSCGTVCSLRDAITAANTAGGANTITFDSSVFTNAATGKITVTSYLPFITTDLTITGLGTDKVILDGANSHPMFVINGGSTVTIEAMTLRNARSTQNSGAAIFSGNGGNATLTLKGMAFLDNQATNGVSGGALIVNNGPTTIIDSTFSGNSAAQYGGSIVVPTNGTLTVINSTFSGNSASVGGAIFNSGVETIINSTLSGNSASTSDAGGEIYDTGTTTLNNSIVANSTSGGDCLSVGTFNANHTLISDGSCGVANGVNGNLTGDPLLGPLVDNGGATQTMLPAYNSPAIDAGDNQLAVDAGNAPLSTDQRGLSRIYPVNGTVDMGAVEVQSSETAPPPNLGGYMSGNWYDPQQSGHGFQLEFANNNIVVAIWFVYTPSGNGQNWIYAQGTYDTTTNTVTLPAIVTSGTGFPPNFVPGDLQQTAWGTLTFSFTDCNHGTVTWSSPLADYGMGSLPLTRLTQIAGTTCSN